RGHADPMVGQVTAEPMRSWRLRNKGSARGSATAPGGKTLSMENIQSISAAYATSGTMYPSERESLEPSGGYPKGTMTLGRSTRRSSYGNRTTAIGSTPNITQTASSMHHISDSCGDQTVLSTGTSSLRRQSGRFTQTLDSADRGEVSTYDLQAQLRDLQRENENLRRELDGGRDGKTSYGMSSVNFWSPDVKRDKGSRREEGVRTPALKEQCRLNQDDLQVRKQTQLPLTVQELQEELRAHRETNSRLRQHPCQVPGCDGFSSPPPQDPTEENFFRLQSEHERQANELSLLRKTMEEMEMRIDSQKQTLGVRDESIQRLLEMLQAKLGCAVGRRSQAEQQIYKRIAEKEKNQGTDPLQMMSRQAYFYRVPPPELHRRNQLQADPAKTRTLQTVIDMKDTKISSLERNIRDLEDEVQMLKTTGLLHPDDRQDELKQVDVYKSHTKFMKTKVDQMKQDLNRKDSEMQALQTKLETLTNQNSDYKQHIEVLKESLSAKEQRANTLQTEVRVCTFINANRLPGIVYRCSFSVRGFFTHSSKQNIIYALTLYRCFDRDSRFKMIENLRDQKEREDRVRLEEMQLMRKGNQELKDKLAAQQSQKLSHSQVTNSSLIPNQRPDGETQKPEETVRTCPDIADRLRLLEQEVARYREESGKSQAEVERLKGALKDCFCIGILFAIYLIFKKLEELMGALEKTRQELDATKVRLSSTQKCLHERDGHLNQLRQERRKQLEEILEMKQQALLAAISEKDANIALLELSSSKRKKAQEEVMALKREKDRLMHQLKQQTQSRMKLIADNYEEDYIHPQHHPHHLHHMHPANLHHRSLPRGDPHANHRLPMDQDDEEGIWA
uniref:ELKS/RAB6-interacting/CAST family member 2 n=1 Tax=Fundulus heteroclitus TaxID=8078 RepID=A0A3Q2PZ44_FUNHE